MTPPTVADADKLAAYAHLGQVDKAGHPYIDHPRAVAATLAEHGDHAVMAGLLHDIVEDTPVTLNDLRAAGYPAEVVSAVDAVTRREGETYMAMIRRAAADPLGRLVKLADNAHNSDPARLDLLPGRGADRLRRKYERARQVLLSGSEETDCLPAVGSVWTRDRDGVTITVTGITTIHGRPNVRYETSHPGTSNRGVGVATLDHFAREVHQ